MGMPTLAAPPGIVLRPAEPGDAIALRALERRCPIVMGDVRVTYDRGDDYFAGARLVGDSYPMVAERDGQLVAVHCVLTNPLRVAGLVCQGTYLHHTASCRRRRAAGSSARLQGAELERHAARTQTIYSYVAVGNEAALRAVPRAAVVIAAGAPRHRLPGAGRPRARAPGDAVRTRRAWWRSSTPRTSARSSSCPTRLARLPSGSGESRRTYGWSHLLLGERAVVGVWPAGVRVLREAPDGREESVRALVLDTGFEPGAEAELVTLLRAWCAALAARGFTH
jgi:hypothetical protein